MIPVILGVLVTIASLMLAFFLAVSNVSFIVENDFMSKAKQNAVLHALGEGQLEVRSKQLNAIQNSSNMKSVLRQWGTGADSTNNIINSSIIYENATGNITVDVEVK
jgi:hypothetical protein